MSNGFCSLEGSDGLEEDTGVNCLPKEETFSPNVLSIKLGTSGAFNHLALSFPRFMRSAIPVTDHYLAAWPAGLPYALLATAFEYGNAALIRVMPLGRALFHLIVLTMHPSLLCKWVTV